MKGSITVLAMLAALQTPAPAPAPEVKEPPPKPPSGDHLSLVPVGGALDDKVKLYFDERSVQTAPDGKKIVWRLFIFDSPRMILRVMSQGVWTLSDYDCDEASVADRRSVLLGMGLEQQRAAAPNAGSRLYSGVMSNAIIAEEVCRGTLAPGYRSASVSEAVRRARSNKD